MKIRNVIGIHKKDLDTPALLLDIAVLEQNSQKMVDFLANKPIKLRPHAKAYRATPEIAHLQMKSGAIGITCAKLSEAEVLAANGIKDILIANQVVGSIKMERLAELAKDCFIKVAVDSRENVDSLSQSAQSHKVEIGVLVEVNIGQNRCGVAPFEPTLDLVKYVLQKPGLRFMGLMGYDGHCTLKITEEERGPLSRKANSLLGDVRKYIEDAGIKVIILSGSGTFTYRFASEIEGITELQAGTYLLMDTTFRENGVREFECTLSVLTTVTSCPTYPDANNLAIVDVGRKSISATLGLPEMRNPDEGKVISLSDEIGRIRFNSKAKMPKIGDKIELWVRDANGTINQFDRFYVIRDDIVEAIWEIPLCGKNT